MKCELCAERAQPRRRLCRSCLEMIERLQRIWPQLDVISRGALHYQAMEEKARSQATAAGGKK